MFERFTESARLVVVEADRLAKDRSDEWISAIHLLLGALADETTAVAQVLSGAGLSQDRLAKLLDAPDPDTALSKLGIDMDQISEAAEETFGEGALERAGAIATFRPKWPWQRGDSVKFSNDAKDVLQQSLREALSRKDKFVCGAHVAMAALESRQLPLASFLTEHKVDIAQLQDQLAECIESSGEI